MFRNFQLFTVSFCVLFALWAKLSFGVSDTRYVEMEKKVQALTKALESPDQTIRDEAVQKLTAMIAMPASEYYADFDHIDAVRQGVGGGDTVVYRVPRAGSTNGQVSSYEVPAFPVFHHLFVHYQFGWAMVVPLDAQELAGSILREGLKHRGIREIFLYYGRDRINRSINTIIDLISGKTSDLGLLSGTLQLLEVEAQKSLAENPHPDSTSSHEIRANRRNLLLGIARHSAVNGPDVSPNVVEAVEDISRLHIDSLGSLTKNLFDLVINANPKAAGTVSRGLGAQEFLRTIAYAPEARQALMPLLLQRRAYFVGSQPTLKRRNSNGRIRQNLTGLLNTVLPELRAHFLASPSRVRISGEEVRALTEMLRWPAGSQAEDQRLHQEVLECATVALSQDFTGISDADLAAFGKALLPSVRRYQDLLPRFHAPIGVPYRGGQSEAGLSPEEHRFMEGMHNAVTRLHPLHGVSLASIDESEQTQMDLFKNIAALLQLPPKVRDALFPGALESVFIELAKISKPSLNLLSALRGLETEAHSAKEIKPSENASRFQRARTALKNGWRRYTTNQTNWYLTELQANLASDLISKHIGSVEEFHGKYVLKLLRETAEASTGDRDSRARAEHEAHKSQFFLEERRRQEALNQNEGTGLRIATEVKADDSELTDEECIARGLARFARKP